MPNPSRNQPSQSPITNESLVSEIHEIADRLLRDGVARGDLKILGRALKELRYAFKVFRPYRDRHKVTVFGSARTLPEQGSYRQAVRFGKAMAEHGWLVITGASSGIMEAGHVGAGRENSMGVNILLPFEQGTNYVIAGDSKLVHLKYFFTRKLLFVKEAHAAVMFPGGFGTMDEAYEVMTLVQTGKREMIPLVYVDEPGGDYWSSWNEWVQKFLMQRGYISEMDAELFIVTDDVDEAVREVIEFYRVYHSMRFVRENLVLRLKRPVSAETLDALNSDFSAIVLQGQIEQRGPYGDEAAFLDLPRLSFRFDRRSFGRLRALINQINRSAAEPMSAAS